MITCCQNYFVNSLLCTSPLFFLHKGNHLSQPLHLTFRCFYQYWLMVGFLGQVVMNLPKCEIQKQNNMLPKVPVTPLHGYNNILQKQTAYRTNPTPDGRCCETFPLPTMHHCKEVKHMLTSFPWQHIKDEREGWRRGWKKTKLRLRAHQASKCFSLKGHKTVTSSKHTEKCAVCDVHMVSIADKTAKTLRLG